jgi:hypothetical protein
MTIDADAPPRLLATIVFRPRSGLTANLGENTTHVAVMDLAKGEGFTTVYGAHHDTSPDTVVQHLVRRLQSEDPGWTYTGATTESLRTGGTLVTIF